MKLETPDMPRTVMVRYQRANAVTPAQMYCMCLGCFQTDSSHEWFWYHNAVLDSFNHTRSVRFSQMKGITWKLKLTSFERSFLKAVMTAISGERYIIVTITWWDPTLLGQQCINIASRHGFKPFSILIAKPPIFGDFMKDPFFVGACSAFSGNVLQSNTIDLHGGAWGLSHEAMGFASHWDFGKGVNITI